MKTRRFILRADISLEFLHAEPEEARALARQQLDAAASRWLTGPRGGKYVPVGPVYGYNEHDHWQFGRYVVSGRVDARYVRPQRAQK